MINECGDNEGGSTVVVSSLQQAVLKVVVMAYELVMMSSKVFGEGLEP